MNRRAVCLALLGPATGCIPSNVIAADARAVATPVANLEWTDPVPTSLGGLYESVDIRGEAAQALQKVYYWFSSGGEFTGAALVLVDGAPEFQTLRGRYRITPEGLVLGDDVPAMTLRAARGHLRLNSPDGDLILRRVGD
jgi:hypothetical protein